MGIFNNKKKEKQIEEKLKEYFKILNYYTPKFSTLEGGLFEMEITRAAIHSFATHVSKLKPQINGSNNQKLEKILQNRPNVLMNTSQYLYRLAVGFMTDNTVFIYPLCEDKKIEQT